MADGAAWGHGSWLIEGGDMDHGIEIRVETLILTNRAV